MYYVRIAGQTIGPIDAAELATRSARWQSQRVSFEVAPVGSTTFVPSAQFLTPASAAPAQTAPPPTSAGRYNVRVNGQHLGTLDRLEIERRAAKWRKLHAAVDVAPAGTGHFVSIDVFLGSLQPLARSRPPRLPIRSFFGFEHPVRLLITGSASLVALVMLGLLGRWFFGF